MGAARDVLDASAWALSVGRLRLAEDGYRWLLAQPRWPEEVAGVAPGEVALALAEVLLDRGDGPGFKRLLDAWAPRGDWRWGVLVAQRWTDMGFLSEARARWRALEAEAAAAGDPGPLAVIRAQHAMVLLQLNRLDEAWGAGAPFALDGAGAGDGAAWAAWTGSRAWGGDHSRTPDAVRAAAGAEGPCAGARAPAPVRWEAPPHDARARVWVARLVNRVLMALDQGAVEDARALVAEAGARLALPVDPSLVAQLAWAKGLLRWAEGDLEAAEAEFAVACDGALAAGRLLDGWNVARAAASVRAALGREPNPWATTERALRQEIVAHLDPADRVFFLANRGDAVDQDLAAAVDRAADPAESLASLHAVQGARWGTTAEPRGERPRAGGRPASWSTRIWQQLGLRRGFGEEPLDPSWVPPACALLYQVSLEREVVTFVVTRGRCCVVRRRCPRQALAACAAAAVGEASSRNTRLSGELYSPRSALGRLAEAAGVEEVAAALGPEVRRVFVVPDGPCVQAPWAALPCGGAPWVERVEIALVSAVRPSRSRWGLAPGAALRGIVATSAVEAPLPFARGDLARIRDGRLGFAPVEASTPAEIERALVGADGAHCACHGVFDPDVPASSGLRVGGALLDLDAISRLELRRLGLLVLASCWTGALGQLPGREFFGVPIALHAAGVGAVVAPLWAASDQYGPAFARAFWEGAADGDAVGALARVQRAAWRSRHPRLWAPWGVWVDGLGASPVEAALDGPGARVQEVDP